MLGGVSARIRLHNAASYRPQNMLANRREHATCPFAPQAEKPVTSQRGLSLTTFPSIVTPTQCVVYSNGSPS